jgi:hypothetical protein
VDKLILIPVRDNEALDNRLIELVTVLVDGSEGLTN